MGGDRQQVKTELGMQHEVAGTASGHQQGCLGLGALGSKPYTLNGLGL